MRRVSWVLILLALCTVALAEDKVSNLEFLVLKDENSKPVRNASVILHPIRIRDGKQDSGGFQLKTNSEGRTSFGGVPYGKIRIQVLARGYQTFGDDYVINQSTTEITIKLKRPTEQFSIYEDRKDEKKDQPGEKKEDEPK
jgi:hypothetical protein